MIRVPNSSEWKDGFQPDREGGLFWYTDVSKTKKGIGAWVYGYGTRKKHSFGLGKYITVLQAEVYVIKACTVDNLDRGYRNRNVYIPSDSHAAMKAHDNYQIN
jgi:hypothetical protein